MTRSWFPYCSHPERLCLIFVFDRTLGWAKQWERITPGQLADGIKNREGAWLAVGVFPGNRRKARAALRLLTERGALKARLRKDGTFDYRINTNWTPTSGVPQTPPKAVNIPKRLQAKTPETGPNPDQPSEAVRSKRNKTGQKGGVPQTPGVGSHRPHM